MKFRLIEKINNTQISPWIINPEDNIELAKEISPILDSTEIYYNYKRDNCWPINQEIRTALEQSGYQYNYNNDKPEALEVVSGYFIVDKPALVDRQDLAYLKLTNKFKSDFAGIKDTPANRAKWVEDNNYFGKDPMWFLASPHMWLTMGGLIIDRAYPMFYKALNNKKITKDRYSEEDLI